MFNLQTIQSALQLKPEMHGWMFTNFSHRDTLTDSLLSLSTDIISTRRWVYIVPCTGEPLKIVHAIESSMLESLPGTTLVYSGKIELENILKEYSEKTFALLADSDISVISTVDAGFIQCLHEIKIQTCSAAPLIQITKGLLTKSGIESHERAAALLYKIIKETWNFISSKYKTESTLSEFDVLQYILRKFNDYSLVYHHEPIVAFGKNAGNPHYSVSKDGSAIAQKGDIIQLDIFAKEAMAKDDEGNIHPENAIYADISWVGVYDTIVPKQYNDSFVNLCQARDIAFILLQKASDDGTLAQVTGFELDKAVREKLIQHGYASVIKHRTGHGIDTACHGSGVNLDSVEFPDKRTVLNGSCFSVEPGIYFEDFGMRTEIDIYIHEDKPIISGGKFFKADSLPIPQQEILYIT